MPADWTAAAARPRDTPLPPKQKDPIITPTGITIPKTITPVDTKLRKAAIAAAAKATAAPAPGTPSLNQPGTIPGTIPGPMAAAEAAAAAAAAAASASGNTANSHPPGVMPATPGTSVPAAMDTKEARPRGDSSTDEPHSKRTARTTQPEAPPTTAIRQAMEMALATSLDPLRLTLHELTTRMNRIDPPQATSASPQNDPLGLFTQAPTSSQPPPSAAAQQASVDLAATSIPGLRATEPSTTAPPDLHPAPRPEDWDTLNAKQKRKHIQRMKGRNFDVSHLERLLKKGGPRNAFDDVPETRSRSGSSEGAARDDEDRPDLVENDAMAT